MQHRDRNAVALIDAERLDLNSKNARAFVELLAIPMSISVHRTRATFQRGDRTKRNAAHLPN